jgi:hypothetical protein
MVLKFSIYVAGFGEMYNSTCRVCGRSVIRPVYQQKIAYYVHQAALTKFAIYLFMLCNSTDGRNVRLTASFSRQFLYLVLAPVNGPPELNADRKTI